ncbi:MAG: SMI1/KNR4 family protein [Anaeromicrobium sp.]|jgi:hypothetical protein|uniref:SMI1/KNR4 family protein n=1 Tax=Anaeromicrobium sp. TaxID=1929132 RepID=UPI0025DC3B2D|nr:SMI1/KNR4 family protein [Anaeromicrobium sp.]MCT4593005.1 SMI1/KNR4 family protein [Anaeromicrobium sp.]
MIRREEIINIISSKKEFTNFTGGVDDINIMQIENSLNVTLSESYKWFIKNYGYILTMGIEIYGVSKGKIPSCIKATEKYRKIGLPEKLVVIESSGEFVYCLDTGHMKDGDCSIVLWNRIEGIEEKYENFYHFFYDRLQDALDNWDEF